MQIGRFLFICFFFFFFCILPIAAVSDTETWILIQKIPDLQPRDVYNVTAVTNLPEGEVVLYQVYGTFHNCPKAGCWGDWWYWGTSGEIHVVGGGENGNLTMFRIDASTLKPDEYFVTESNVRHTSEGTAIFNILDSPDRPYWITFGPVRTVYIIEPLEIFGTTNIPEGEEIYNYLDIKTPHLTAVPRIEDSRVLAGMNGLNRTVFRMESCTLEPGIYELNQQGGGKYAKGKTTFLVLPGLAAAPGFWLLTGSIGLVIAGFIIMRRKDQNRPRVP